MRTRQFPLSRDPRPRPYRAQTAIYHCNVSDSGQICLDILHEKWNPTLTVPKALEAVRILLASPDTDNALRQVSLGEVRPGSVQKS